MRVPSAPIWRPTPRLPASSRRCTASSRSHRKPDALYLHDLAVHPAASGLGLGPQLVRHAWAHAVQAGWRQSTLVSVQASVGFYNRPHGRLGIGHQPHDRAAGSARPVRVRLDQIEPTLQRPAAELRRQAGRRPEAAIISTCNRTEIYCAGPEHDLEPTIDWLAQSGGVAPGLLRSHAYMLQDGMAARHAFRVASGLDSMVLGEAQILGQMKDAVRAAEDTPAPWAPRSTSCSSARSRSPRKCAAPPRSAPTRSAWPPPPCGWPGSCSRT
jgi:hypothetical protein